VTRRHLALAVLAALPSVTAACLVAIATSNQLAALLTLTLALLCCAGLARARQIHRAVAAAGAAGRRAAEIRFLSGEVCVHRDIAVVHCADDVRRELLATIGRRYFDGPPLGPGEVWPLAGGNIAVHADWAPGRWELRHRASGTVITAGRLTPGRPA
jgi:hypothetical protein